MQENNGLPDGPPTLQELVLLSNQQIADVQAVLGELSEAFQWAPVVFSQDGQLVAYAGVENDDIAEGIAKQASQHWREGATRIAREYISFEEKSYGEGEKYSNVMLYSVHISGALTLTVGLEFPNTLNGTRQRVAYSRGLIRRILA